MTSLKPLPAVTFRCPHCDVLMPSDGWAIPGMWTLGTYTCDHCQRRYLATLPSGLGLLLPTLLDAETNEASDQDRLNWYARHLASAYASRSHETTKLNVTVEALRPLRKPVIVNALERIYGYGLLSLLNVQPYLDTGWDVWLIVPRWLRWMVPDGVAEIWTVDLPLSQGSGWYDDLDEQIHRRVDELESCALATVNVYLHERYWDIERFTGVRPFDITNWRTTTDAPVITFIWRGDRPWGHLINDKPRIRPALRQRWLAATRAWQQRREARRINRLAALIKAEYPQADFAVVGLGRHTHFSRDVGDLRTLPAEVNDAVERAWCERYARSHVVIGVEGSNMLLPSACAATVLELLSPERYGHLGIMPPRSRSNREVLCRNRLLPLDSTPETLARFVFVTLNRFPEWVLQFNPPWSDPEYAEANFQALWQRFAEARTGTRFDLR